MNKTILSAAIILGLGFSACTYQSNSNSQTQQEEKMEISNKQKIVSLLKSIETGEPEPVGFINPDKYVQHNLGVADGLAGFGALLQQLPPNSTKVNTVRAFQDGDYVFTHTDYNFFGPKIGFDIFRFENSKIVEHWDNLQETSATSNPSGHTMIDGSTEIKDLGKTEANKTLVRNFVDDILVNGRMEKLAGYFNGDNYIQHNPLIPDQLSGLGKALEAWAKWSGCGMAQLLGSLGLSEKSRSNWLSFACGQLRSVSVPDHANVCSTICSHAEVPVRSVKFVRTSISP